MITNSLRKLWAFLPTIFFLAGFAQAAVLEGTVRDLESGEPIPHATVRVLNSGLSAAANDDGEYRLKLKPGIYELKFSHIAHYSEQKYLTINEQDTAITLDIALRPGMIVLNKITAYSRAYDPGQRIILEAIERKQEILDRLASYQFDAYTKVVAEDAEADSAEILVILESQIEGYWKKPDDYKEIIVSRRQTANIAADQNMLSVGQILNFNQNRLDLGTYSVVSPTAEDALDHYNYYLMDTLYHDGHPVFRLEIEPKNELNPLFVGTIDIADSTYEVVGVEVTFSKGFETRFFKDIKYHQTYGEFRDEFWMPVEIRFEALIEIGLPGIPQIDLDYVASLYDYSFEIEQPDKIFNGYTIEIAKGADEADSSAWTEAQIIPLTDFETDEYARIDSVEKAPRPFWQKAAGVGFGVVYTLLTDDRLYRFNRSEGSYLGFPLELKDIGDRVDLTIETGYSFGAEFWQHHYEADVTLSQIPEISIGGGYRNQTASRSIMQRRFADLNPTFGALINGDDPFDYYRSEGFHIGLRGSPIKKLRLDLRYNDHFHRSIGNNTDFTFSDWFDDDTQNEPDHRINPPVQEGHLRSFSGGIAYDSRPLINNKGKEETMFTPIFTQVGIGVEHADPDLIDSDMDFTKFYGWLYRRQAILNLGVTQIYFYGGYSERKLPPQRFFMQDFGEGFMISGMRFKTLHDMNFVGDRAFLAYGYHDFGRRLFLLSGIPLIRDIPFSLGVHGGAFFTRFDNIENPTLSELHAPTGRWYKEIGFSIGEITPLDFKMFFTWQISDYKTDSFSFNMGMGLMSF